MNASLTAAAALAASAVANLACARDMPSDNYVQLNLGSGFAGTVPVEAHDPGFGSVKVTEHFKPGFFGSALAGHNLGNGLSVEAEGYFYSNNIDTPTLDGLWGSPLDVSARAYGAIANVKFETPHPVAGGVSPYVAGGVGYGGVSGQAGGVSDSSGGFTWQLKTGLALHSSSRITWDLGYRYLTSAKYAIDLGGGSGGSVLGHVHTVSLGARFGF
jgi:opacity protein-like surface antigen